MKVDIEELGACKRRLQVEETPEVVQKAWEQAFGRVQSEAKLPGFRKGKVPRSWSSCTSPTTCARRWPST